MDKYYLIAKGKKTNKIYVIGEFYSIKIIDSYTTNYYNNRDLSEAITCSSKNNDFFIAKKNEKGLDIMDVLYADSREVKTLMNDSNEGIDNVVNHFLKKMEANPNFYNMVMKLDDSLYDKLKNNSNMHILNTDASSTH